MSCLRPMIVSKRASHLETELGALVLAAMVCAASHHIYHVLLFAHLPQLTNEVLIRELRCPLVLLGCLLTLARQCVWKASCRCLAIAASLRRWPISRMTVSVGKVLRPVLEWIQSWYEV